MYILFLIVSIVLINLFIGLVSEVYNSKKEESEDMWNKLITHLMEESLIKRQERRFKHFEPKKIREAQQAHAKRVRHIRRLIQRRKRAMIAGLRENALKQLYELSL